MVRWLVQPLRPDHDRSAFACGQDPLDDFLKARAGQYARRDLARTYVAVRVDEVEVLGYYSLAAGGIDLGQLPAALAKKLPRHPIPAILLARLAVDSTVQGQGLGGFILKDALIRCYRLADQIGIFAVVVDAIDEAAVSFYGRFGFTPLTGDPRRLCLPIDSIEKGLGRTP